MTDKLHLYKPWIYPAPGVTQEDAAMILGEPLASALAKVNQETVYVSWLRDEVPENGIYTTIEEKE